MSTCDKLIFIAKEMKQQYLQRFAGLVRAAWESQDYRHRHGNPVGLRHHGPRALPPRHCRQSAPAGTPVWPPGAPDARLAQSRTGAPDSLPRWHPCQPQLTSPTLPEDPRPVWAGRAAPTGYCSASDPGHARPGINRSRGVTADQLLLLSWAATVGSRNCCCSGKLLLRQHVRGSSVLELVVTATGRPLLRDGTKHRLSIRTYVHLHDRARTEERPRPTVIARRRERRLPALSRLTERHLAYLLTAAEQ